MSVLIAAAKNPILPEMKEVIWFSIVFVFLFVLMKKFALPPLQQAMEERSNKIRNSLEEAEQVRQEAQSILEDYQRQLSEAKGEANRIIEEARDTAENMRRDLMERAESEVEDLRQRARDEITAAQERALSDLQSRVGAMAIELAEKVVESSLDREANQRLIDSYIEQVGARG
jgi:F-type H+-transporting ATPase subunit b